MTTKLTSDHVRPRPRRRDETCGPCADSHGFDHRPERLNYFYGQLLGVQDFRDEQRYFLEKMRLHNRCLHGYGAVCGLEVTALPTAEPCEPAPDPELEKRRAEIAKLERQADAIEDENPERAEILRERAARLRAELEREEAEHDDGDRPPALLCIDGGLALDCLGNELHLPRPITVDPWAALSDQDRARVRRGERTLYVSICYQECPTQPVRPIVTDLCGAPTDCAYGRIRDGVRVEVTVDPPAHDDRCETCCDACCDPCLLLARVDGFAPGRPLRPEQIDNGVRRMLGVYTPTTITGISWVHGASYTSDHAKDILGTTDEDKGIEIRFSRPVHAATLAEGVLDLWVVEGGAGRAANIYYMSGAFIDPAPGSGGLTSSVRYRQTSGESLQSGDRVLITLRAGFVLDECCQAIDGEHNGRAPLIVPDYEENRVGEPPVICPRPRHHFGPWTTGNRTPGGNFESWFFIA